MIKDIIEKAKLTQWVKNDSIHIGWKHDWLKRPKIVKALSDLKKYETSVDTVKFNHLITNFIKTYDDGVDKLEVIYGRDIRKSS
jgi:poly-D-alanine transfer protein DltD